MENSRTMTTTKALAYCRTSSLTNVGGDSEDRQRLSIDAYAKRAGLEIAATFYDAAVSGADPIDQRAGFLNLLAYAKEHGVGVVLVETASRFARDLMVQELGLQALKREGIALVAVDSPDTFTNGDPMVEAVRQMMGVMAQLDKAVTVAKLKGARDRASEKVGHRVEGRTGYKHPRYADLIRESKRLHRKSPRSGKRRSLRTISAELGAAGYVTEAGLRFSASQVQRLLAV